jgi:hypothetical protein
MHRAYYYAKEAERFSVDNYRMQLAIATNPHIDGNKQRRLWDNLSRSTAKVFVPKTEEEVKKMLRGED